MRTSKQKKNTNPDRFPVRRLTVSYRNRFIFDPRAGSKCIRVPDLRISGKWLQPLGFTPSTRISVTATPGLLVITTVV